MVGVGDLDVARGRDHAGGDVDRAGRRKVQPLGALAFHLERDLLDVEHDVGDVLADPGQAREFMQHAVDLDRGDGGALERAQQHPAKRVAERHSKAALERLGDEHRAAADIAPGVLLLEAVGLLQFLPVLCVDGHFHPLAAGGRSPGFQNSFVIPGLIGDHSENLRLSAACSAGPRCAGSGSRRGSR